MSDLQTKTKALLSMIRGYGRCGIAFSGGVDSSVVCKAAFEALGENAVAVTGVSASLAAGELETAREIAREIGIRHTTISTREFASTDYTQNANDRCFHCKTELYGQMEQAARELGFEVILNGANLDDLDDYRPGLQAARDFQVKSPLAECGFSKPNVRELAKHWDLSNWDKAAAPCLSSRVAYGEQVTAERLRMIDEAERMLREIGCANVRVRFHSGEMARIEVPVEELSRLVEEPFRETLARRFRELGFRFITLDLEGFRSGNLNQLVQLDNSTLPIAANKASAGTGNSRPHEIRSAKPVGE